GRHFCWITEQEHHLAFAFAIWAVGRRHMRQHGELIADLVIEAHMRGVLHDFADYFFVLASASFESRQENYTCTPDLLLGWPGMEVVVKLRSRRCRRCGSLRDG